MQWKLVRYWSKSVKSHVWEKIISETWIEFLVFLTFSKFFMNTFIYEHDHLLSNCAGPFTYACCENGISRFSAFSFLKFYCVFFKIIAKWKSSFQLFNFVIRVMMAVELHFYPIYHCQHLKLTSLFEKSQSVPGSKFFPSYRAVFEVAQGPRKSRTNNVNCSFV